MWSTDERLQASVPIDSTPSMGGLVAGVVITVLVMVVGGTVTVIVVIIVVVRRRKCYFSKPKSRLAKNNFTSLSKLQHSSLHHA